MRQLTFDEEAVTGRFLPDGRILVERDSMPPTASVSRPSFVAHTSSSPRNAGVTYSAGSSCGVKSVISPLSTPHR